MSASPDFTSARGGALNAAQVLAQQLNGMSADIQGLRTDTEQALSDSVNQANTALQQIARINQQLAGSNTQDAANAGLLDQRDAYIDQLSTLMDIRVIPADHNQVNVFTNSGTQLVGAGAATLKFDAKGGLTPDSQWNADPTKSSVGTISLVSADRRRGRSYGERRVSLRQDRRISRDARPSPCRRRRASSTRSRRRCHARSPTRQQTARPSRPAHARDLTSIVGSLLAGNTANLTYTDNTTGQQHKVTIVRVDDPSTSAA